MLSGKGVIFEVDLDSKAVDEEAERSYNDSEVLDYSKLECLGLVDEKTYSEEPFTEIGSKMVNVTEDGKVKKSIIRDGYGDVPQSGYEVTVDYNAYIEFNDTPFDSTYVRKRPLVFQLNSGSTILGLDAAVQTMKINEKAQFLFHYDYAYGKFGCLDRIPPESSVLFEIELRKYINTDALSSYNKLSVEEQKEFANAYRYAQAICLKAKDLVSKNIKSAIKEYNIAASKLEYSVLKDSEDEEKQQLLLLRIYTNLVVCYIKIPEPRKTCIFSNKIFNLTKGTNLSVPAKVYFNNARALRQLGDYALAEKRLKVAQKLQPNNTTISEEFVILEQEKKTSIEKERNMAKAMINNKSEIENCKENKK